MTLTLVIAAQAPSVAQSDTFVDSVAPVLARRCLSCHNETKSEGGLSMVDPTRLITDGYISTADSGSSHLLELITPEKGQAQMPKNSDPLRPDEIDLIRRWIDGGAQLPDGFELRPTTIADRNWWSLKPITMPAGAAEDVFIDHFIDAKLLEQGLIPLPPADPITLIRRVTYDLSGLPPTPEQIDAFVAAHTADPVAAWGSLVDRLLNAPEFGEKWGQHWLDLARYAETHGYDKDQPRPNAWPYRDYVINSLNADKPVAQFVREQIAGDVLSDDSVQGIVATGFLTAGPWDLIAHQEVGEEKLDGRIAKHLDRDEMATAVFNVFQSTTIQCAQCHNHKFDPISSEDYYRVHAVFAGIDRADRVYSGLSLDQQEQKRDLENERAELTEKRKRLQTRLDQDVVQRASAIAPRLEALTQKANATPPPPQHGFHSQIASRDDETKWIEVDLGAPRRLDSIEIIACYDDFNDIGSGFGFPVRFRVQATDSESFSDGQPRTLLDNTTTDYPNPKSLPLEIDPGEQPIRLIRITATKLAQRRNDYILALGELRAIESQSDRNVAFNAKVTASDQIPPNARWAPQFLVDEVFHRLSLDPAERNELRTLYQQHAAIVAQVKTPQDQQQIRQWDQQIAAIEKSLSEFPIGKLVYAASTEFQNDGKFRPTHGKPRPIHLLHRGDLRATGDRVLPGAPRLWNDAPTRFTEELEYDESRARATLAEYITRNDNPLLWRSIANRLWQWTFGSPLVATPNDFGRMGARPTHPELLDALATRLRDDPKQSIKSMVRLFVTSDAYRRASFDNDRSETMRRNATIDASNEYCWRFNRRRLTAEEFRDTILAVSASLRLEERSGPSFQDFVVERPQHSPHYEYDLHDPNDPASHRRTIYRFVVRSQPQPMLTTLDCADPSISIARRDESTTALQALAQWNNRLVESMSKRFATRLAMETEGETETVRHACRLAWGRTPNETEHDSLNRLLVEQGRETFCRVILNTSAMMYLD